MLNRFKNPALAESYDLREKLEYIELPEAAIDFCVEWAYDEAETVVNQILTYDIHFCTLAVMSVDEFNAMLAEYDATADEMWDDYGCYSYDDASIDGILVIWQG